MTGYRLVSTIPVSVCYVFALVLVVFDIYHGKTSVGTFSLMIAALGSFIGAVNDLSDRVLRFGYGAKYVHSLSYLNELEYEPANNTLPVPQKVEIAFHDVHFTYPGSEKEIIKGISLNIRHGEKIAIVGLNGSGKSTFTYLLTGLYAVNKGEILINGTNINHSPDTFRRTMSCIFQDFGQFDMSIADNIKIGDTSREISDEELQEICDRAGVTPFVNEMEHGLDTVLGDMGDKGVNLSGGQWQRIMFARALIRKDAGVLIFDEPTAALDPKSEAQLYEDFQSLTGDKTVITISHRLGITRIVDRILVFEDGTIVEDGNHNDLIRQNGLYKKMYQSQSQWYC